jgi:hypothetical protein
MPNYTSYASLANSGQQIKRIAYFNSMAPATTTTTTSPSPCGSSYTLARVWNYNGCSGFTEYTNSIGSPCCVSNSGSNSGQVISCPQCMNMNL